jgi:hypothetical protein
MLRIVSGLAHHPHGAGLESGELRADELAEGLGGEDPLGCG